jgi:hypothetical protein
MILALFVSCSKNRNMSPLEYASGLSGSHLSYVEKIFINTAPDSRKPISFYRFSEHDHSYSSVGENKYVFFTGSANKYTYIGDDLNLVEYILNSDDFINIDNKLASIEILLNAGIVGFASSVADRLYSSHKNYFGKISLDIMAPVCKIKDGQQYVSFSVISCGNEVFNIRKYSGFINGDIDETLLYKMNELGVVRLFPEYPFNFE